MRRPDRKAFARDNAAVLAALFAGALIAGLVLGNLFAVLGGAGGIGWVAWATLSKD